MVKLTDSFAYLFSLLGQRLWIGDVLIGDGSKEFLFVFAVERWLADQHFVEKDTVGPPVDATSVRLVQNDLNRPQHQKEKEKHFKNK